MLAALAERRRGLEGPITADELFEFDQDHYGGLGAVDALARRAAIGASARVLDLCAGLGGPARFLASRRGARVVALELHSGRAASALRLTRKVGLAGLVNVVRGDAQTLPFADGTFDACVSQEALMHIADKATVLSGCRRVLRPGGRLAFTDWIARPRLGDLERARLREWMAAVEILPFNDYRVLLRRLGFADVESEDLADEWRPILRSRMARWEAGRGELGRRLGHERYRQYAELYAFLVRLVENGKLVGGRFTATR